MEHRDPYGRDVADVLAARLAQISTQLDYARQELELLRGAAQGSGPAAPGAPPAGAPAAGTAAAVGHRTPGAPQARAMPVRPTIPGRPGQRDRSPWWAREATLGRVLATAGTTITLIGVALLLALAIQSGLLGPAGRVVVGALLASGLLALALWRARRDEVNAGIVALAATGVAGLYLDLVAATALYELLPAVVGLAIAFAVALAGAWLAVAWDSRWLAHMVVLGAAGLAPFVGGGAAPAVAAFLVALMAATFPAQRAKRWPWLTASRIGPAVLALLIVLDSPGGEDRLVLAWQAVAIASVLLLLAVATGAMLLREEGRTDRGATMLGLAIAALPLLLARELLAAGPFALVCVATGAILLAMASLVPGLPASARLLIGGIGVLAGIMAITAWVPGDRAGLVVLGLACAVLLAWQRARDVVAGTGGAVLAVVGTGLLGAAASQGMLVSSADAVERTSVLIVTGGALLVIAATVMASAVGVPVLLRLLATGAALYGSMVAIVALGVLALAGRTGFVAGHALVTVLWMAVAIALLMAGARHDAALAAGAVMASSTVAKLMLFDLAALDGLYRVLAFLLVGILLLLAGARIARIRATGSDVA
ncbi:DUF2339 domain-containing protein [Lolliginicoccus suaedae]|uniref:DUF2339 domain-containing protein n=1 Tax=Lolliginicoccus suaedae TaxID=2605429 RepID=UPI0011ED58D1|nr:DUF2339 domain-containing protein [Lolliginicoccus suaedae]